jgi:hypothetical protein
VTVTVDFGTDLFGEVDTLLDGLDGEVRPVRRDLDVIEHRSSSYCFVSL